MTSPPSPPSPPSPGSPSSEAAARRAAGLAALEREVGVLVRRVRRVIHERARLVHPSLQPAAYLMLAHLADGGPQRSSAMADAFGIDKGAISRQVQQLEELGLVERSPDPDDGRATLVAATADAVRRLAEVSQERRRWLDAQLAGWADEDLEHFAAELARYNRALNR